jgi:6-phosphogluconolactonase (cycloisomerase 2 family)
MRFTSVLLLLFLKIAAYSQNLVFEGKGLLYLQDADFNTFSLSLGKIEKESWEQDRIGAFQFPIVFEDALKNAELPISNGTMKAFKTMAVSSNNRLCYIAEASGEIKKNGSNDVKNLPIGGFVSIVDISNLKNLKANIKFQVGDNPRTLALNSTNQYLVVGSEGQNQEFTFFELDGSGIPLKKLPRPSYLNSGAISDIVWHPTEKYLGFINSSTKEVGLMKLVRDLSTNSIIRLEVFGNTVKLDGDPSNLVFSKDGNFLYVLDRRNDPTYTNSLDKSYVFSIKLNLENGIGHSLISKVETDVNSVGMVLHPEGKHLVVNNIRRSFEYPVNDRNTGKSSLSVVEINQDGTLVSKGNFMVDAIMPMGLIFDRSGKHLAMSAFQFMNYGKPMGGIEFFNFNTAAQPMIERQNVRINTNRGIGVLKLISDY